MKANALAGGCVLALALALGVGVSAAQTPSDHPDGVQLRRNAESALEKIQRNDVGQGIVDATYYIEIAAHVEPDRAIPILEAYFARAREAELRSEIASVLVSLGDKDPKFFDLILQEARSAVDADPPDPFANGQGSNSQMPCSSDEFFDWAKKRGLSPERACRQAASDIPQKLRALADSGDRRGIPELQKALRARSSLIRGLAAQGLVLTGDREAVTSVLDAVAQAPQDEASNLAQTLIESDDPRAESVVHQYVPEINFQEAREFHAKRAQLRRPILIRE